jgi:hypothetical protein
VAAFRKATALPQLLLHPRIRDKIWGTFLRGDHDTAVFQSFKEVEVAVREACTYEATDLGVSTMRRAFAPDIGPLTDKPAPPKGGQQAYQISSPVPSAPTRTRRATVTLASRLLRKQRK